MALNRVNADSIADGTVIASDIADGTITLAKLQSGLLPSAIANSGASYANAAFAAANSGGSAASYANSAFAQANTDYTTITTTAATYGNATSIPTITLAANGRVTMISNTSITSDPLPQILMLSGM